MNDSGLIDQYFSNVSMLRLHTLGHAKEILAGNVNESQITKDIWERTFSHLTNQFADKSNLWCNLLETHHYNEGVSFCELAVFNMFDEAFKLRTEEGMLEISERDVKQMRQFGEPLTAVKFIMYRPHGLFKQAYFEPPIIISMHPDNLRFHGAARYGTLNGLAMPQFSSKEEQPALPPFVMGPQTGSLSQWMNEHADTFECYRLYQLRPLLDLISRLAIHDVAFPKQWLDACRVMESWLKQFPHARFSITQARSSKVRIKAVTGFTCATELRIVGYDTEGARVFDEKAPMVEVRRKGLIPQEDLAPILGRTIGEIRMVASFNDPNVGPMVLDIPNQIFHPDYSSNQPVQPGQWTGFRHIPHPTFGGFGYEYSNKGGSPEQFSDHFPRVDMGPRLTGPLLRRPDPSEEFHYVVVKCSDGTSSDHTSIYVLGSLAVVQAKINQWVAGRMALEFYRELTDGKILHSFTVVGTHAGLETAVQFIGEGQAIGTSVFPVEKKKDNHPQ